MNWIRCTMILLCMALCLVGTAQAATYYVATTGNDTTGNGSSGNPWKTIQKGIDMATAGDTINVAAGTYQQRLTIGSGKNNLSIVGAAGTIIDGSDVFNGTWALDGGFSSGWGVYSTSLSGYSGEPRAVFVDDKMVAVLSYNSHKTAPIPPFWYDPYYYMDCFKYGMWDDGQFFWSPKDPQGWNALRGLAMYRGNQNKMYLKVMPNGDNAGHTGDPISNHTVKWSNRMTNVIAINGSNGVRLSGFEIKYGWRAVLVENSVGTIIEYCKIVPTRNGIRFGAGSDACIARYNEIASTPYGDVFGSVEASANYWMMVKGGGFIGYNGDDYDADHCAIFARGSAGNHYIHDNYIHDAWDGIGTGDADLSAAASQGLDDNVEVYHNRIHNMIDDSLDPSRDCTNNKWHANYITNGSQHIRVRGVCNGPFYLYNNIFQDGPIVDNCIMFYGVTNGAEVYFYNNTIDEGTYPNGSAPIYENTSGGQADFTNVYFYNNIFYGDAYAHASVSSSDIWDGDYNVFFRRGASWDPNWNQAWAQNTLLIEANSDWYTTAPGYTNYPSDVSLTSGSAARGQGANLSGWGLPGGYSTDCGALPYGTAMPQYYPFADAPTLSNISPVSGTTAGGTACTLTGTNLTGCSAVSFGGSAGTSISVVSATQVRCTSPSHSAGDVSVTATTGDGTSNGVTYTYSAPSSPPTLSSINPNNGTTAGGTACTLTGTNLTGCSSVSFSGSAATGISVDSSTQVRCASPAHSAGGVTVTATTPYGTSNGVAYTYTTPPPGNYTTTLNPTADGWVDSTAAGSNKGSDSYPKCHSWDGNKWRYLIFKFDLNSVQGSTITSATLRVRKWASTAYTVNLDVMSIADDSWTEGGVTWNNRPAKGTSKAQITVGTAAGYYEWDITSYVSSEFAGNKIVSMYITDETNQNKYTQWASKEKSGYKPELVVISQ